MVTAHIRAVAPLALMGAALLLAAVAFTATKSSSKPTSSLLFMQATVDHDFS